MAWGGGVKADPAVALVETLVHLPSGVLAAYSAQPVEFDEAMLAVLTVSDLPADWRADPPPPSTRAVGDEWVLARALCSGSRASSFPGSTSSSTPGTRTSLG
jgi:hypothetical protein